MIVRLTQGFANNIVFTLKIILFCIKLLFISFFMLFFQLYKIGFFYLSCFPIYNNGLITYR